MLESLASHTFDAAQDCHMESSPLCQWAAFYPAVNEAASLHRIGLGLQYAVLLRLVTAGLGIPVSNVQHVYCIRAVGAPAELQGNTEVAIAAAGMA
jgi:hypothetical protein